MAFKRFAYASSVRNYVYNYNVHVCELKPLYFAPLSLHPLVEKNTQTHGCQMENTFAK